MAVDINYQVYRGPINPGTGEPTAYYGLVLNKGVDALSSLREVMAYKMITAYDPQQVRTLFDSILQGAMELTALDGRPRSIGNLIRTHLAFDKAFESPDVDPRSLGMNVRIRALKDLKIPVDTSNFSFIPPTDVVWPKITRVFPASATAQADQDLIYKGQAFVLQGVNLAGKPADGAWLEFSWEDEQGDHETSLEFTNNYFRIDAQWNASLDALLPGTPVELRYYNPDVEAKTGIHFVAKRKATVVAAM